MIESVSVIRRIQPYAGHAVLLVTTPEVFFPVRPGWIDAANGDEQAIAARAALLRQEAIDRVKLLVQDGLEAAGPRLGNAMLSQLGDQRFGTVVLQLSEG